MAFDLHHHVRILGQPGGLAAERLLGLGDSVDWSSAKKTRSPTFTAKSCSEPGTAWPALASRFGVLFFEQAESARRQQKAAAILKLTDVVMS